MKCWYCHRPNAQGLWAGHKFCQQCSSKIHTLWGARWILKRDPELEQYAHDEELDKLALSIAKSDKVDKIFGAAEKRAKSRKLA